ncbi:MAG: TIGR03087 family PEP-CTERM/XrtA system glycosyltransferase [Motiliproteus sp.]|nr:TIGR03087 family PEP-CTERM/XrtA system glycosyltransferase [Motiliproteus sp.]MCW9052392.1 TIGR03087 family PEP-CTERM/XrtA system glycosyltransferase [Motiliproteus sp.]
MEPLLFLCHRIPYPPNKGDKIRSFNILKNLSTKYRIHLGCFVDDPDDLKYLGELKNWCADIKYIVLSKKVALLKSLSAFPTRAPLSVPYYYDQALANWVSNTIEQRSINRVFTFSSSMAQYIDKAEYEGMQRIIDFVDVDSDKWRQYADKKSWPMSWVYSREYRQLKKYEEQIAKNFDASILVSNDEAALFKSQISSELHPKVHSVQNGVDLDFFDPSSSTIGADNTSDLPPNTVVFTGAMDYWANVDAVKWFADEVWPHVIKRIPDCKFYIVGGNPTKEVKDLGHHKGIHVTGRVHDIRPYLAQSTVSIAPLQIARGIQNKVLEAMAMAKPIVATSLAMEGIQGFPPSSTIVEDIPEKFADALVNLIINSNLEDIGQTNREWVIEKYSWNSALTPLSAIFESSQ